MSKKSNVHPDYYKTAGRDPQGQGVIQEVERQKFRQQEAFLEKQARRRNQEPAANLVPAPEQNRSQDMTSGQDNSREREHANNQPKTPAEKERMRRVAGKPKASPEEKPSRRVTGKAAKRDPAPRAAKAKSKSQKQVSKRAAEKRPRVSSRSGRK